MAQGRSKTQTRRAPCAAAALLRAEQTWHNTKEEQEQHQPHSPSTQDASMLVGSGPEVLPLPPFRGPR
eukprot:3241693-Rhodomonas_salina.1